jgi:hypothetical protein
VCELGQASEDVYIIKGANGFKQVVDRAGWDVVELPVRDVTEQCQVTEHHVKSGLTIET